MKMHLFKSHSDIFLSANIKNVVSHINAISEPGTLKSVEQLDRETLIRMDGRLFDLHDLNRYYQNKARNEGFTFGDDLSIRVKGKIVPVVADKTRTLLHIFIDKIAEGQTILAYDDYAKDYTKQQFMTAIKRITDKMEVHIQREDKKYYLKLPLAYRITKKSPNNHQKITNWQSHADWAIAHALTQR